MATVPRYDTPAVSPSAPGPQTFRTPSTSGGGDIAAQQIAQFGKAMQGASAEAGDLVLKAQQEANQLRVDDAINSLKEQQLTLTYDPQRGYTTQRGNAALQRESGMSLSDEYGSELDRAGEEIAKGLGNDAQRAAFAQARAGVGLQFRAGVTSHEVREFTDYSVSVRDGTIALASDEIVKRYNDPTFRAGDAALSIQAAVAEKGRVLGWSAVVVEAAQLEATSRAHRKALDAALDDGNLAFVQDYRTTYGAQMTGEDLVAVDKMLGKEVDTRLALSAVDRAFTSNARAISPTDGDRAFNLLTGQEAGTGPGSAPRQFGADGKPLTSPKGALGSAQIMPGTGPEAARLAGLPWDPQRLANDAQYNLALGRAYFNSKLQTYGGNVRQAWAAYNAGDKWVQAAIKRAGAAAPGTSEADWFWQLNHDGRTPANRAETENYVTKLSAAYGTGLGAPPKPTLNDIITGLRADPTLAGSPTRLKAAEQEAATRWTLQHQAEEQRQSEALSTALRMVQAEGRTYETLPASVREELDPTQIDTVRTFATSLVKKEPIKTDMAVYQRLSDPVYLRSLSPEQFYALRPHLSDSDFTHFADERGKPAGGSNLGTINTIVSDRLRVLEMDPTPKDGGTEAARVGAIRQFVTENVAMAERRNGKPMSETELQVFVNGLFAKSLTYDRKGLFGTAPNAITTNMMTMDIGDIPDTSVKALRDAFKRRGVPNATDWQIVGAYWRMKSSGARAN